MDWQIAHARYSQSFYINPGAGRTAKLHLCFQVEMFLIWSLFDEGDELQIQSGENSGYFGGRRRLSYVS